MSSAVERFLKRNPPPLERAVALARFCNRMHFDLPGQQRLTSISDCVPYFGYDDISYLEDLIRERSADFRREAEIDRRLINSARRSR